jgi:hypothetical protein
MKTTSDIHTFNLTLSPSADQWTAIREQLTQQFGADANQFSSEYRAAERALYDAASTTVIVTGTEYDAQVVAEPIRMQFPDRHVNIYWTPAGTEYNNGIYHTTWNDQMKMFPEYAVYTHAGLLARYDALKAYHHYLTVELGNWSPAYTLDQYITDSSQFNPELIELHNGHPFTASSAPLVPFTIPVIAA